MTPNLTRKNYVNSTDDAKSIGCSTIHDHIQQPEVVKTATKAKMDAHQTIESFIKTVSFFCFLFLN
jgi:hypothetical protein